MGQLAALEEAANRGNAVRHAARLGASLNGPVQRKVDASALLSLKGNTDKSLATLYEAYAQLSAVDNPALSRLDASPLVRLRFAVVPGLEKAHGQTRFLADGKTKSEVTAGLGLDPEAQMQAWATAVQAARQLEIEIQVRPEEDLAEVIETINHELSLHALEDLKFAEAAKTAGPEGAASLYPPGEFHTEHQRFVTGQHTEWAQTLANVSFNLWKSEAGEGLAAYQLLRRSQQDWEVEKESWLKRLAAQYRGWAKSPVHLAEPSLFHAKQILRAKDYDETPEQVKIRQKIVRVANWTWDDYRARLSVAIPRPEETLPAELGAKFSEAGPSGSSRQRAEPPSAVLGVPDPLYRRYEPPSTALTVRSPASTSTSAPKPTFGRRLPKAPLPVNLPSLASEKAPGLLVLGRGGRSSASGPTISNAPSTPAPSSAPAWTVPRDWSSHSAVTTSSASSSTTPATPWFTQWIDSSPRDVRAGQLHIVNLDPTQIPTGLNPTVQSIMHAWTRRAFQVRYRGSQIVRLGFLHASDAGDLIHELGRLG